MNAVNGKSLPIRPARPAGLGGYDELAAAQRGVRRRNSSGLDGRGGGTRSPRSLLELPQPSDGLFAKRSGFAGDGRLPRLLDAGHAPVECRNQLLKLANQIAFRYRHDDGPDGRAARRDAFHTSPQRSQRQ
jgi:hypothetical protein